MTKTERAAKAHELLKILYPDAVCSLDFDPEKAYELLISVRLAAQCTDARVNIVTKVLFDKYRSMRDFAEAKLEDVEEIVKPCGFYHMKAKDIIAMCRELIERYDGVVPDSIEELVTLPGVGRKTANLIVGDVYGKDSVVTDTHCIRICGRLGLTTGITEPVKVEMALRKILDLSESGDFCHRLVLFGRDICTARAPKCGECPLKEVCEVGPDAPKAKKTRKKEAV